MVRFRGIDVRIVSQLEIRRLPEFRPCASNHPFQPEGPTLRSGHESTASCYVPICPGSQIWFDYLVDAPHPPDACYFFKMIHNGKLITSWDCTAKHGYQGQTTYNIQYIGNDNFTGMPLFKRQAFRFSPSVRQNIGPFDDCIEIRVHRIEHRQRISIDSSLNTEDNMQNEENSCMDGIVLVNGGILEPAYPHRRYCYQLLDPVDEPYATIRFLYRSYEFLEEQNIIPSLAKHSPSTSSSSSNHLYHHSDSSPCKSSKPVPNLNCSSSSSSSLRNKTMQHGTTPAQGPSIIVTSTSPAESGASDSPHQEEALYAEQTDMRQYCTKPRDSDDSLHFIAKDNLENFHVSPRRIQALYPPPAVSAPETTLLASPQKRHRKYLTINLDGTEFELEKKKKQWWPLSPFTCGGTLRRSHALVPPSAPAAMTEFGPNLAEEVQAQLELERAQMQNETLSIPKTSTKRTERGGKMLLNFLGKRLGRS